MCPTAPRSRRGNHVFALWAGIPLLGLAAVFAWAGIDSLRATRWHVAKGTLQSTQVHGQKATRSAGWRLDMDVEFTLSGVQQTITRTACTARSREKAEARLADWPVGKLIDVYCRPGAVRSANGAALARNDVRIQPGRDALAAWVGASVLAGIAAFLFWLYRRGRRLAPEPGADTMNFDGADWRPKS